MRSSKHELTVRKDWERESYGDITSQSVTISFPGVDIFVCRSFNSLILYRLSSHEYAVNDDVVASFLSVETKSILTKVLFHLNEDVSFFENRTRNDFRTIVQISENHPFVIDQLAAVSADSSASACCYV